MRKSEERRTDDLLDEVAELSIKLDELIVEPCRVSDGSPQAMRLALIHAAAFIELSSLQKIPLKDRERVNQADLMCLAADVEEIIEKKVRSLIAELKPERN